MNGKRGSVAGLAILVIVAWGGSAPTTLPVSRPVTGPIRGGAATQAAAGLSAAEAQRVADAVRQQMQVDGAVGVAVGVVREGEVAYAAGFGLADRVKHTPVTTQTSFRWASCSKCVTGVAAMQLVEEGKLDLEADVRKYVPEWPDKGVPITIHELLCHQGGVTHYGPNVVVTKKTYSVAHPFADVVTALDLFKATPLVCEPGTKFSYSTHGFILLSAAVERAGKQSFAGQVRERIATPLEMRSFQPDYQWVRIPERTNGYHKQGDSIVESADVDVSWKLGGGGFTSNVVDFAKFVAGLGGEKLLRAETKKLAWTDQLTKSGAKTGYGLGIGISTGRGGEIRLGHSGAQEKTRTHFVFYPDRKFGVVVMTNSEWVNPEAYVAAVEKALR